LSNAAPPDLPRQPLTVVSSIGDFADWFKLGNPVLMYHKLGPHPAGTKMRGLYVGNRLFERQTGELSRHGFSTPSYDSVVTTEPGRHRIFLTFDDGFENVFRHGIAALGSHRLKAIQFLVADRIGKTNDWETAAGEAEERLMDAGQIREWLAAGHEIGSHTLTHPKLTHLTPDQAREEISASRKKLEDTFGIPVRHFCYPFGDHDRMTVDLVREAGYKTACTTTPGLNRPETDPFEIRRIMARHGSRKWSDLRQRMVLRFKRWLS
jgi:peptidoglycan/xylan/chitin deacetylase (PgdA/CDA1 family)